MNTLSLHHNRVRAAFDGRWADRVAVCEQAIASSVASKILGRPMDTGSTEVHYREALAWLDGEQAHAEYVDKLYRDALDLNRRLDLDILCMPWRLGLKPTRKIDDLTILYGDPDGDDWMIYTFDPASRTFGKSRAAKPVKDCDEACRRMRADLAAAKPPGSLEVEPMLARAERECGHEFVLGGVSYMAVPMEPGYLEATLLEPDLVAQWLDLCVEWNLAYMEAQARLGIWLFNGGGDLAFNDGPIYSPRFFEAVMAPRWKRLFDFCRQRGLKFIFRSDGNLWPIADSLFGRAKPHAYYECDYDAGMRFAALRQAFPELVLMGNVSCDYLHSATPQEVRQRTIENIQAAGPRVIVGSANSILHGTPPENVLAMLEAAKSYVPPKAR